MAGEPERGGEEKKNGIEKSNIRHSTKTYPHLILLCQIREFKNFGFCDDRKKHDLYLEVYAGHFVRGTRSVFGRCQEYLKGLFHECKSNTERMAERMPDSEHQNLHHFISHSA